jgi:hypothetical protein
LEKKIEKRKKEFRKIGECRPARLARQEATTFCWKNFTDEIFFFLRRNSLLRAGK